MQASRAQDASLVAIKKQATCEVSPRDNLMEQQIRDGQSRLGDSISALSILQRSKMVLTAVSMGLALAMVTSLPGLSIR